MPVTVFPNQSGRVGLALQAPRSYVRGRRQIEHSNVSSGANVSLPMYQLRQHTTEDAYTISTTSSTLLRSTLVPIHSQRPMYEVTTDISSGASATTILWKVDLQSKKVKEVARVTWANSGNKTLVEMAGVRVPASEFLTKPKWRLGVTAHATRSFTSQMEEYKWVPQPTLFDSESCVWHCVQPISRGPAVGPSTILAVYRPSSFVKSMPTRPVLGFTSLQQQHQQSQQALLPTRRSAWRSSMSLESLQSTLSLSRQATFGHAAQKMPASLEIYPEVDGKPHLRNILVLTAILVVTGKDEWKSLPHSWDHQLTTPELVLARLTETYRSHNSSD